MPAGSCYELQLIQAQAMIDQLQRANPSPPVDFDIRIHESYHEAGMYLDLQLWYTIEEGGISESYQWALDIECNLPERWDDLALQFLATSDLQFTYSKTA